jgi:hypothetical protein
MVLQRYPFPGIFNTMGMQPFHFLVAMSNGYVPAVVWQVAYGQQHALLVGQRWRLQWPEDTPVVYRFKPSCHD